MAEKVRNLIEKNKFVRRLLALVLSFSLLLAILIVYLHSTFGWFANNRQVSGNGMGITIDAPAAEAEYTAYVYDPKLQTVHYTGEGRVDDEGNSIDPSIDDLKMQVHDVIFKSRNRYTPAIVRIHLSNISQEYRNGGTISITIGRDGSPASIEKDGVISLPEKSTSVLRFTLAHNSSWYNANAGILYDNIDKALYQKILDKDYNGVSSMVFTTVTGTGDSTEITKVDSITLSINYSASDVVDGEMDVYFYITYDVDLVERFENASGIDTTGTTVGKVSTMVSDLTFFRVDFSTQS